MNSLSMNNTDMEQCHMTEFPAYPMTTVTTTELKNANETSAGSLGLGAALAVAYDLTEDPNFPGMYADSTGFPITSQSFSPFSSVAPSNQVNTTLSVSNGCDQRLQKNGYYMPLNRYQVNSDSYWSNESGFSSGVPMTAYLNPIPTTLTCRPSETSSYFSQQQQQLQQQQQSDIFYLEVAGPASESTMSTDSMLSIRSDNTNGYNPAVEGGYTLKPIPVPPLSSASVTSPVLSSRFPRADRKDSDSHKQNLNSSSTSSDDGLYELSEEDLKIIDDTLTQNSQVTSSRHWKYYIETNEWTRATCALMACLFSRDQMANSTVLGRGGSQRERLPTNLVAYVVTKMRRRFNKPAAAVRARMAQKCKDERRFGRVLPIMGAQTSVAAVCSRHSSKPSSSGSSTSRRRSAAKRQHQTLSPPTPAIPSASCYTVSSSSPYGMSGPHSHHIHHHQNISSSNGGILLPIPTSHDPPVMLASTPEMAS